MFTSFEIKNTQKFTNRFIGSSKHFLMEPEPPKTAVLASFIINPVGNGTIANNSDIEKCLIEQIEYDSNNLMNQFPLTFFNSELIKSQRLYSTFYWLPNCYFRVRKNGTITASKIFNILLLIIKE